MVDGGVQVQKIIFKKLFANVLNITKKLLKVDFLRVSGKYLYCLFASNTDSDSSETDAFLCVCQYVCVAACVCVESVVVFFRSTPTRYDAFRYAAPICICLNPKGLHSQSSTKNSHSCSVACVCVCALFYMIHCTFGLWPSIQHAYTCSYCMIFADFTVV